MGVTVGDAVKFLFRLLAHFEALIGWLLRSFRSRDAGLFTRSRQFRGVPETVRVTSKLGACGLAQLPITHTAVSEPLHLPARSWQTMAADSARHELFIQTWPHPCQLGQ